MMGQLVALSWLQLVGRLLWIGCYGLVAIDLLLLVV